ncbi:unnamed protein product [Owenia fusiformis]|uniref:Centrosomal protein CCDC61 n=1 Tax=Owenia fusiformis TaxID=6347 RepID=A0A8J1Y4Z9_OWEFU|nr:unnamed protein product [Owenia fusiformis]
MEPRDDCVTVGTYIFRGVEYVVTMNVTNGNSLIVEVEDRLAADQWRGTFDAAYIEDLTHKTGNFKQFPIFINMLESAVTQTSDSVSLDLLTYADLESLRSKKPGVTSKVQAGKTQALNTKRYLILTYSVEFDRIHYPLPLPYMGKPDPKSLQETIRDLRAEIKSLKQHSSSDYRLRELDKYRKDYELVLQEKEDLEADFLKFRRELKNTTTGNAAKEIRILKNVIKNLEEDLLKEKTKHQRSSSKRSQEYRSLLEEVEELRAAERNLRVRVKSLTNELALYKRRGPRTPITGSQQHASRPRERSLSQDRPQSRERSWSRDRSRLYNRDGSGSRERRGLTDSQERRGRMYGSGDRLGSQPLSGSRERTSSQNRRFRERSGSRDRLSFGDRRPSPRPSPALSAAGARNPRFDPTAFIREKERKRKESELKSKRNTRYRLSGSTEKKQRTAYGRKRTSSIESAQSLHSSQESLTDIGVLSDASEKRLRDINGITKTGRRSTSTYWDSPNIPIKNRGNARSKLYSSTPDSIKPNRKTRHSSRDKENYPSDVPDSDFFDRSNEMTEIDARLNRLQQFMKTNMPT